MANRFHGSYRDVAKSREHGPRGVARASKLHKREEAEARNRKTEHYRTKAHRKGRCARPCPINTAAVNRLINT